MRKEEEEEERGGGRRRRGGGCKSNVLCIGIYMSKRKQALKTLMKGGTLAIGVVGG